MLVNGFAHLNRNVDFLSVGLFTAAAAISAAFFDFGPKTSDPPTFRAGRVTAGAPVGTVSSASASETTPVTASSPSPSSVKSWLPHCP
jgi:hypothetical protein